MAHGGCYGALRPRSGLLGTSAAPSPLLFLGTSSSPRISPQASAHAHAHPTDLPPCPGTGQGELPVWQLRSVPTPCRNPTASATRGSLASAPTGPSARGGRRAWARSLHPMGPHSVADQPAAAAPAEACPAGRGVGGGGRWHAAARTSSTMARMGAAGRMARTGRRGAHRHRRRWRSRSMAGRAPSVWAWHPDLTMRWSAIGPETLCTAVGLPGVWDSGGIFGPSFPRVAPTRPLVDDSLLSSPPVRVFSASCAGALGAAMY